MRMKVTFPDYPLNLELYQLVGRVLLEEIVTFWLKNYRDVKITVVINEVSPNVTARDIHGENIVEFI
jgi:hypothetical protein